MNTSVATIENVPRYVWKFAEYLEQKDLNPYKVARHGKDESETQSIYRLARKGADMKRLDLSSLALVIEAIRKETGETLTPNDLLEYDPTN